MLSHADECLDRGILAVKTDPLTAQKLLLESLRVRRQAYDSFAGEIAAEAMSFSMMSERSPDEVLQLSPPGELPTAPLYSECHALNLLTLANLFFSSGSMRRALLFFKEALGVVEPRITAAANGVLNRRRLESELAAVDKPRGPKGRLSELIKETYTATQTSALQFFVDTCIGLALVYVANHNAEVEDVGNDEFELSMNGTGGAPPLIKTISGDVGALLATSSTREPLVVADEVLVRALHMVEVCEGSKSHHVIALLHLRCRISLMETQHIRALRLMQRCLGLTKLLLHDRTVGGQQLYNRTRFILEFIKKMVRVEEMVCNFQRRWRQKRNKVVVPKKKTSLDIHGMDTVLYPSDRPRRVGNDVPLEQLPNGEVSSPNAERPSPLGDHNVVGEVPPHRKSVRGSVSKSLSQHPEGIAIQRLLGKACDGDLPRVASMPRIGSVPSFRWDEAAEGYVDNHQRRCSFVKNPINVWAPPLEKEGFP